MAKLLINLTHGPEAPTRAALGFLVGTAIAGQTFYNFTLDNLRHFGALKAMGAGNGQLLKMILLQAGVVGTIGADQIWRDGDRYVFSIGPRVLFSSARYQRAYFGVTPAAAQGGVRTEVGASYGTALDSSQAVHRTRPPDVFHRVTCRWVDCRR